LITLELHTRVNITFIYLRFQNKRTFYLRSFQMGFRVFNADTPKWGYGKQNRTALGGAGFAFSDGSSQDHAAGVILSPQ
jgi:hypothetical protein